jgi:hypothetical protein
LTTWLHTDPGKGGRPCGLAILIGLFILSKFPSLPDLSGSLRPAFPAWLGLRSLFVCCMSCSKAIAANSRVEMGEMIVYALFLLRSSPARSIAA